MIRKISILIVSCFVSIAHAQLLADKNDIKVEAIDVDVLLETGPVIAQKKVLKDKSRFKRQLEQLYLKKAMARMAEAEGLGGEGINAVRLQAVIDNALFLLKLDALKLSDKKDYSKVAYQLYQVNEEKYKIDERVDAAHILVSTKELADDKAFKKVQLLRQELVSGANFNELATRESDDKSVKKNQGELGAFTRDKMVKPFSDMAFSMQEGAISVPVKTRFGYHIIKLNKKIPAGVKAFDEIKASIIDDLKKKEWEIRREEFYQQLKTENKMEFDEQALDAYISKKLDEL